MQIVIDISEKLYNDFVLQATGLGESMLDNPSNKAKYAIANGTPLPPHGKLIDADYITKDFNTFQESFELVAMNIDIYQCSTRICCLAPTILEATKGEEE